MCNRYDRGDIERTRAIFGAREPGQGRLNLGGVTIHPKDDGIVFRLEDGERVIRKMCWGFPHLTADMKARAAEKGRAPNPKPVNNARFDKLSGFFWRKWAADPQYRCIIPAARYAEAVGEKGQMTETWLSLPDQPVFAWAGLWRPHDEWGDCYTGVMTDNAPELAHVHDRSPVILAPEDVALWLEAPLEELYRYDRPWPAHLLKEDATDQRWARPRPKTGPAAAPLL